MTGYVVVVESVEEDKKSVAQECSKQNEVGPD